MNLVQNLFNYPLAQVQKAYKGSMIQSYYAVPHLDQENMAQQKKIPAGSDGTVFRV